MGIFQIGASMVRFGGTWKTGRDWSLIDGRNGSGEGSASRNQVSPLVILHLVALRMLTPDLLVRFTVDDVLVADRRVRR
jgi:hypothetical protein